MNTKNEAELIGLLEKLVAIPSVNPEDTSDPAITGELRLAGFLEDYLGRRGFRVRMETFVPDRPNLIAEYGPAAPRRTIMLEAHMDTVGVAGMKHPPFTPVIEGDRLYARGACDTKGAMAAGLWALQPEVLATLAGAGVGVMFVGTMGEEKGNQGAKDLVKKGLRADEAIILEPTDLAVVHAHKGAMWLHVTFHGRAAHGSRPEQGVSAIAALAEFVQRMQRDLQQAREAARAYPEYSLLGPPTINLGKVHGGSAVNIVPAEAWLEVDRRTLPSESSEAVMERARVILEDLKNEGALVNYQLKVMSNGRSFYTPADAGLVRRLSQATERAGVPFRTAGAPWFSDAGPFATTCGEVVVFGPGSIAQAHTAEEFVSLTELRQGAEILRQYLLGQSE